MRELVQRAGACLICIINSIIILILLLLFLLLFHSHLDSNEFCAPAASYPFISKSFNPKTMEQVGPVVLAPGKEKTQCDCLGQTQ